MTEKKTVRESLEEAYAESYNYHQLFDGESDRGAAVLAVARFEDRLQKAIESRDETFKDSRGLRFGLKIEIAYALGLYDQKIRDGLCTVANIRNEFAHSPEPMEFDHEKVAAKCRELNARTVQSPDDLRERYLTYLREVENSLRFGQGYESKPM